MIRILAMLSLAAFAVPAAPCRRAAAQPFCAQPGVLVLKNGEVLSGQIILEGDRYIVAQGDRSELRIPASRVEMHCKSLEEAYTRKEASLTSSINSRLNLVEWCLRQSLLSQAADQLLKALAIDPGNPRIAILERRLRMAVEQPSRPANPPVPSPSRGDLFDLDRITRELPEEAVESFTANIQPLLLNRCGTGACHGNGTESKFRLVRPTWGKTLPRRFTQRNLYAATQQLDREHPENSPLLVAPSQPHGNLGSPVFGATEQNQFKLLIDWVRLVTSPPESSVPTTITPAANGLIQASFQQAVSLPAITQRGTPPPPGNSSKSAGTRVPASDPFDPAQFNRQRTPSVSGTPE